jgi:hypothetical protein
MSRREKIIEILNSYLSVNKRIHEGWIKQVADEILALPLDVPSDKEIERIILDDFCFNSPAYNLGVAKGMREMRGMIEYRNSKPAIEEIKKRNQ